MNFDHPLSPDVDPCLVDRDGTQEAWYARLWPRRITTRTFAAGVGFVIWQPASARADVPPPPGYVESCTVDKRQSETRSVCELCSGAYYGDTDFCDRAYAGRSFVRSCQTRGASTWQEVWCDPAQPLEPGTPAPGQAGSDSGEVEAIKNKRGCQLSIAADGPNQAAGLAALLAGGALLFGQRRRRRSGAGAPSRPLSASRPATTP